MVDTSSSLNPDTIRCAGSRQTASYSNARATDSRSVNLPLKAWSISAAEAPLGLRRPATTTLVSNTHLIVSDMTLYTMSTSEFRSA